MCRGQTRVEVSNADGVGRGKGRAGGVNKKSFFFYKKKGMENYSYFSGDAPIWVQILHQFKPLIFSWCITLASIFLCMPAIVVSVDVQLLKVVHVYILINVCNIPSRHRIVSVVTLHVFVFSTTCCFLLPVAEGGA
uniref:Uncharacterized protein n=1 Tax=Trypanosoma congolense (strain IL3000) TaxID=1068625 RepID=G0UPF2_TRYCI|nr:hypothetical protein, unlikely [Trypanosoma congolense IL3000]